MPNWDVHIGILNDPNNFHTRKWVRALRQAGAEVTVFSFDEDRTGDHGVNLWRGEPGSYRYRDYLNGGAILREALEKYGIEVVNALNVTPFGVWAARSNFRPLVVSALGADILEYPPRGQASPWLHSRSWANVEGKQSLVAYARQKLRQAYFRPKVKAALERADLVTGDNQVLVEAVRDWFGVPEEKIHLMRWGVEPELFAGREREILDLRKRFGIGEGNRLVLSPRGAKAIYNADLILEGFARSLERQPPDTHFMMLSAGYEVAPALERRAELLAAQYPNFHFVKEILPREQVLALWHLVDVFVSAPIYDGYSAALAEGRYVGAIPVVNAIPGNLELIEHQINGWVVEPFNPENICLALQHILQDLSEWKARFAPENRRWIERHSLIQPHAVKFLDLVEKLLRNAPAK